jgi:hypothetical protein
MQVFFKKQRTRRALRGVFLFALFGANYLFISMRFKIETFIPKIGLSQKRFIFSTSNRNIFQSFHVK